ncbi:MAG: bifunctional adenosylcobinamide kinase/adenosylcobinamide-phosphate guanylyltransferase [Actinobacteria bacterium]|nr:MAG: bifunctional adenosylcobinamide kinase/adenosylcobinamide-phosphate guanylyltransferase [Actinomycetota bacterium]
MITLVLGGARSGKSAVAEGLASTLAGGDGAVTYIATAIARGDADFAARIRAHQNRRPASWSTVEAGADLVGALGSLDDDAVVLVDSLGTWVGAQPELAVDIDDLVATLRARMGPLVLVSDEVGLGVHPSTAAGLRFRDTLGELNVAVAEIADDVLLVVAGRVLPLERP